MIYCNILRTNRTIKKHKVKETEDKFKFEGGTYFVKKKHVILQKGIIGFRPTLYYIENVSEPISFENINLVKTDDNEDDETNILIDAKSIHDLTSREMLSVLTKQVMTKSELFKLVMIFLIFITNLVIIGMVR